MTKALSAYSCGFRQSIRISETGWLAIGLVIAAFIIRLPQFGNPLLHVDEQFYLMVGDRMVHGALPYVDIWDRKPVGLFLIYATIRLLGGNGIVQYQIVATLFAAGTAFVIGLIARRQTTWVGAIFAGILYLLWIAMLGGNGGQSPVFYNLLIAGAALTVLRACDATHMREIHRRGTIAMLLVGAAIQVKYPALVEGCFFGIVLMWLVWRHSRSIQETIFSGMTFAAIALLPTIMATLFFFAIGSGEAFWFANYVSIFKRPPTPVDMAIPRIARVAVICLPLALPAAASLASAKRLPRRERLFIGGWLLAAMGGFALVGNYYDHYAIPFVVPLAASAAPALAWRPYGPAVAAVLAGMGLSAASYPDIARTRLNQQQIAAMSDMVSAHMRGGCLYVFDGPPILYHLAGSCLPTRYVFPEHLNYRFEINAIGVNPLLELGNTLRNRPDVIVTAPQPINEPNDATRALLGRVLKHSYRLVGTQRIDEWYGHRTIQVYTRLD